MLEAIKKWLLWIKKKKNEIKIYLFYILSTLLSLTLLQRSLQFYIQYPAIPFSDFINELTKKSLHSVHIYENSISFILKTGKKFRTIIPQEFIDRNKLWDELLHAKVNVSKSVFGDTIKNISKIALILSSMIYMGYMYSVLNSLSNDKDSNAITDDLDTNDRQHMSFTQVAGVGQAKEELMHIVNLIKQSEQSDHIVPIPRGVLLYGPSGTGKTLLAKAVAAECEVSFFACSGSSFVDTYVGRGATRVRDLFNKAHKSSPSIVFIDEIDCLAQRRDSSFGNSHEEREQTLNQLLYEMDSIKNSQHNISSNSNEASSMVLVIAATNRPKVLDPAIMRSGRLDYHIEVPLPTTEERLEILRIHCASVKIDANLDILASSTSNFTGADLKLLVDEASRIAFRKIGNKSSSGGSSKERVVDMDDFQEALQKLTIKTRIIHKKLLV